MEIDDIQLRSDPVKDILTRPPNWLVRWGITVIAGVLTILVGLSFLVKYPDELVAEATITTEALPTSVKAVSTGPLAQVMAKEGQEVAQGAHLAIIENAGKYAHWLQLSGVFGPFHQKLMESGQVGHLQLATGMNLGDVQPAYTAFFKAYQDYWNFEETNFYEERIAQVRNKIVAQRQLSQGLSAQKAILLTDYQLAQRQFETDQQLHQRKAITDRELEQSKQALLQQEYQVKSFDTETIGANIKVQELEDQVLELRQAFREERMEFSEAMKQASLSLEAALSLWQQQYVLTAPIAGKVSFFKLLSDRQFVREGDEVMVVVPQASSIFAYTAVGQQGFGKMKVGQAVNIRLNGFPFEQFGVVRGEVKQISAISRDGRYMVHLALPSGLTTSYGKKLPFSQEMTGEAHIITEDLRLIERIFYQLRKVEL
jgi:HlyD family secretion protein